MEGTLHYLNDGLLDAVDGIITKWPDARLVIVSGHGGRFTDDPDKGHRIFLAGRTPEPLLAAPTLRQVGELLRSQG